MPTIIPAYIKIHDRDVETPTSIFASLSPTSASPFETTTTSPSPTPTNSGNSRWVFRSWDDTTIAFTVIIAVCVIVAAVLFCASYIQACLKSRRGSRNALQVKEQTDENATARQNKWYNRLKRQTSSQTRSPEGIPLDDVRTGPRSRVSSHQTNAANTPPQTDQPPAYTRPATPPPVILTPAYTSIDMALPTYNTYHWDRIYAWERPHPILGPVHVEEMPAPTYERHWNPWSTFDQTGRDDQRPGLAR